MDYSREAAALRAALQASQHQPHNPQRAQDVYDCVTLVTDALHRDGFLIETVIIGLRQILREWPHTGVDEEVVIRHAIVQYYR